MCYNAYILVHSFPIPGEEKLKVYDLLAGSPKEQDNSELRVHTGHGKKKVRLKMVVKEVKNKTSFSLFHPVDIMDLLVTVAYSVCLQELKSMKTF